MLIRQLKKTRNFSLQRRCGTPRCIIFCEKSLLSYAEGMTTAFWSGPKFGKSLKKFLSNEKKFCRKQVKKGRRVRAFGAHATASSFLNIHFCELFFGALESSYSHGVVERRILMLIRRRAEILGQT